MVTLRSATTADIPAIKNLLHASLLTSADIEEHIANFFVAENWGALVGVGRLENCGAGIGLLRSFAVLPEQRNRRIAQKLYEQVLARAHHSGISALYLLTVTAQGYFAKLGFVSVARTSAPQTIRSTQQFRELCPDSAVLMYRMVVS